jgi:hypothetical protein
MRINAEKTAATWATKLANNLQKNIWFLASTSRPLASAETVLDRFPDRLA